MSVTQRSRRHQQSRWRAAEATVHLHTNCEFECSNWPKVVGGAPVPAACCLVPDLMWPPQTLDPSAFLKEDLPFDKPTVPLRLPGLQLSAIAR